MQSICPEYFTWNETLNDDLVRVHKSRDVYDDEENEGGGMTRVAYINIWPSD